VRPLLLFVVAISIAGCGPSAEDLKARLGGLDEALVVGVTKGDSFIVTGRCRGGSGFEVKVELGDADQRSLDVVADRAKDAIHFACLGSR
jgi:hypothetical protein